MGPIVIPDTAIVHVNRGKRANEVSNMIYRDADGKVHIIDFATCAANYAAEHPGASPNCIGERKADAFYFLFYTSGIKTKIVFKKMYVGNLFGWHFLSGAKNFRFLGLRNYIWAAGYTTYDLS